MKLCFKQRKGVVRRKRTFNVRVKKGLKGKDIENYEHEKRHRIIIWGLGTLYNRHLNLIKYAELKVIEVDKR